MQEFGLIIRANRQTISVQGESISSRKAVQWFLESHQFGRNSYLLVFNVNSKFSGSE